jgi:hypothetical protein
MIHPAEYLKMVFKYLLRIYGDLCRVKNWFTGLQSVKNKAQL